MELTAAGIEMDLKKILNIGPPVKLNSENIIEPEKSNEKPLNGFYLNGAVTSKAATVSNELDELNVQKNDSNKDRGRRVRNRKRTKKDYGQFYNSDHNRIEKTKLGRNGGSVADQYVTILKGDIEIEQTSNVTTNQDKNPQDSANQNNSSSHSSELPPDVISDPQTDKRVAVGALLVSVYKGRRADDADLARRSLAFKKLKDVILSVVPDTTVRIYGSMVAMVALKSSDVNVNFSSKQPKEDFNTLRTALETNHQDVFKNIQLTQATNSMIMTLEWQADGEHPLVLTVKANVDNSVNTSRLLGEYCRMDPRVAVLAACLRAWAQVFHLDRQEEGTLPPHSFHIMVVHFLQRIKILPVLPESQLMQMKNGDDAAGEGNHVVGSSCLEKLIEEQEVEEHCSIAVLWTKMLVFYDSFSFDRHVITIRKAGTLVRNSLGWGNKNIAIQDPYCWERNLARSMRQGAIYTYLRKQFESLTRAFFEQHSPTNLKEDLSLFFLSRADVTLPPKMCTSCQTLGHIKQNCPEENVEVVAPPPPPTETVYRFVNTVLEDILKANEQTVDEVMLKERIKDVIENFLKTIFPDKEPLLTLFGSSCNGFGFRKSDLDLSLSFRGQEPFEMSACVKIINELADGLLRDERYEEVIAITTAKVPIVKFCLGEFECDICLYNTLAQHNTRLLARYAELDRRARLLGYAIKHLAKVCHMCDASKGSLSSYAYTLMAIYFLQRTDPPVLPILQEGSDGSKPTVMVEGWDVWFEDDGRPWTSENAQSPGRLWLEMIQFYSISFNYDHDVVSIRQKERLGKTEKNWSGSGIAIEDPFNLDHNLGARLTNRMCIYIRKAFQKAMLVFASETDVGEAFMSKHPKNFLFNKSKFTDGPPPNDRGCRRCFKLGHYIADCPKIQRNRKQKMQPNEKDGREPPNNEVTSSQGKDPSTQTNTQAKVKGNHRPETHAQQQTSSQHHVGIQGCHANQQQLQLPLSPTGVPLLQQSPQKRPLLQLPSNLVQLLPQNPQGQMPHHFYPHGIMVPQYQFHPLQQQPLAMPGVPIRLPQTIPSMNTVFKRSDFPQQDSHHPHHGSHVFPGKVVFPQ